MPSYEFCMARRKISREGWEKYLHTVFNEPFITQPSDGYQPKPQFVRRRKSALRAAAVAYIYDALGHVRAGKIASGSGVAADAIRPEEWDALIATLLADAPIRTEETPNPLRCGSTGPQCRKKKGSGSLTALKLLTPSSRSRISDQFSYDASQALKQSQRLHAAGQARNFCPTRVPYVA
jgi:hypothetical protein